MKIIEKNEPVNETLEGAMSTHNDALDALQELGKALLEAYPDTIEDSEVEKAYMKVYHALGAVSISLCCVGNEGREKCIYGTNDGWYVTKDGQGGI